MKQMAVVLFLLAQPFIISAQHRSDSIQIWNYHFQLTTIDQAHPGFKAAYFGNNSLINTPENGALSVTTTLFAGRSLWKAAATNMA